MDIEILKEVAAKNRIDELLPWNLVARVDLLKTAA
jgi:hypothetical protein